jgi:hypothetical protein
VKPVVPSEGVVIFDFGTGRHERSIGKVVLQWQAGTLEDPRFPPFSVTCDVCENSAVGLFLGDRFWRRGRGAGEEAGRGLAADLGIRGMLLSAPYAPQA